MNRITLKKIILWEATGGRALGLVIFIRERRVAWVKGKLVNARVDGVER